MWRIVNQIPSSPPSLNAARSAIDPAQNVLLGARAIMRYLGIHQILTLYKWVDEYALPAIKSPNGQWLTTCTAIDTWIFMTAELDYKNRKYNRGTGFSPEVDMLRTSHLPDSHPRRRRAQARYADWLAGGCQPMKPGPKPSHRIDTAVGIADNDGTSPNGDVQQSAAD